MTRRLTAAMLTRGAGVCNGRRDATALAAHVAAIISVLGCALALASGQVQRRYDRPDEVLR